MPNPKLPDEIKKRRNTLQKRPDGLTESRKRRLSMAKEHNLSGDLLELYRQMCEIYDEYNAGDVGRDYLREAERVLNDELASNGKPDVLMWRHSELADLIDAQERRNA